MKWWKKMVCWRRGHDWRADDGGSPYRLAEETATTCARCERREVQPSCCARKGIDLSENPEDYLRRIREDWHSGRPLS